MRRSFSILWLLPAACVTTLTFADDAAAQSRRAKQPAAPSEEGKVAPKQEKQFPLGQAWTASSLNGKPFGAIRPTLTVDENLRGTGFAGCNTFSATTYPLREQNFATGPVAVTKKACPKEASDVERSFLVALRGARTWDNPGGRLVIKGAGGEITFERGI